MIEREREREERERQRIDIVSSAKTATKTATYTGRLAEPVPPLLEKTKTCFTSAKEIDRFSFFFSKREFEKEQERERCHST